MDQRSRPDTGDTHRVTIVDTLRFRSETTRHHVNMAYHATTHRHETTPHMRTATHRERTPTRLVTAVTLRIETIRVEIIALPSTQLHRAEACCLHPQETATVVATLHHETPDTMHIRHVHPRRRGLCRTRTATADTMAETPCRQRDVQGTTPTAKEATAQASAA